ncbi:MAG TPA: serine/threonine-protein kinase, partial [Polyangiaceae bacterium]|nr:serine/threonine-protein kinase [Polyangiaceae bacterium]
MGEDLNLWREALGGGFMPGDVLVGKYRLERIIGIGGMGVIVEARHLGLDEKVALKLLKPTRLMNEKARARFSREARAGFKITSEHVARVFDLGTLEDGMQYMAMEFLEGRDFAQLMAQHGRLPSDIAVGFILQVCEAVAEAHAIGIVHRDLKPENLFLCKRADGTPCVKVLDFGLAKLSWRSQSLTRVNRGMGTPRYMAPEQWVSARDVGPAADIWALGIILYELISGFSPFDDKDIKKLSQQVLFGAPQPLSQHASYLPHGLVEVIECCMQKKPEQRYASIAALAAELLPYAPQAPLGRLDDMVRAATPITSNWALSLSASNPSGNAPWLDGTLASANSDLPNASNTDELTTVDEKKEPPVDWVEEDTDTARTEVLKPEAVEQARTATPRRRSRLAMLAAIAVIAGAMLAFATVRDPRPETAPTTRTPEAPRTEQRPSPKEEPVVVNEAPPANPVVTASAVVLEEAPAPAPRPRRRFAPRPRPAHPAPPPPPPAPASKPS